MSLVASRRAPLRRIAFASVACLIFAAAPVSAQLNPPMIPAPVEPIPTKPPAGAHPRAAIDEVHVDGGDTSQALGMQLQDGFVVGLTRSGIAVYDSVDVAKRIEGHPELGKCDSPICLKRLGQLLGVRYLLRLRVAVNGNSYRMTARLFSTEGSTPAMLPVDTQSRFCDVCTVAEARDVMIRLADAIKRPLEDVPVVAAAPPAPPPAPPSYKPQMVLAAGLVATMVGSALFLVTTSKSNRAVPGLGGLLTGVGLSLTGIGIHLMAEDRPQALRTPAVSVAFAW